jgi:hypothetical protein
MSLHRSPRQTENQVIKLLLLGTHHAHSLLRSLSLHQIHDFLSLKVFLRQLFHLP